MVNKLTSLEKTILRKIQTIFFQKHNLKLQKSHVNHNEADQTASIYTVFSSLEYKVKNIQVSDYSVIVEPFSGIFTRISFFWDKTKIEMKTSTVLQTKTQMLIKLYKKSLNENNTDKLYIQDSFSFTVTPEYIKQDFLEDPSIITTLKRLDYENVSSLVLKLSISKGNCLLFVIASSNPHNITYLYQLTDFFSLFLYNFDF